MLLQCVECVVGTPDVQQQDMQEAFNTLVDDVLSPEGQ
jgi:hypothetical protein